MDQQQIIIWFAGFYEGEGTISNDITNRNRYRVSIAQNDRTPLDIGQKIWGGNVRERIRKSPASDKICKGHEWQLNHNDSIKFIEDIKPFMIIPYKIQQIKICEEKLNQLWDKKYKCSFCEVELSDLSGRLRHEKIKHIEKGILHKCNHCEKTYLSRGAMKRHIKINHS
jgi:hypothetical protein